MSNIEEIMNNWIIDTIKKYDPINSNYIINIIKSDNIDYEDVDIFQEYLDKNNIEFYANSVFNDDNYYVFKVNGQDFSRLEISYTYEYDENDNSCKCTQNFKIIDLKGGMNGF